LWDSVQKKLSDPGKRQARTARTSLLTGLLYDETGDRLTPSHSVKAGRRYRYYISHRLMQARRRDEAGWRLPAEELEKIVVAALIDLLGDEKRLTGMIGVAGKDPSDMRWALDRAADLSASIAETFESRRDLICSVMSRIVVAPQRLSVTISHAGLCSALDFAPQPGGTDKILEVPFTLRRRGVEARLVIAGDQQASTLDRKLIETIAQAHEWMARLSSGQQVSIASLAREVGLDDGEISRVLPLAFLAPDIVSAILNGRQPVELTARHITASTLH
jgi:site-specific DNA recombinase